MDLLSFLSEAWNWLTYVPEDIKMSFLGTIVGFAGSVLSAPFKLLDAQVKGLERTLEQQNRDLEFAANLQGELAELKAEQRERERGIFRNIALAQQQGQFSPGNILTVGLVGLAAFTVFNFAGRRRRR